jgi:hypothetical protein
MSAKVPGRPYNWFINEKGFGNKKDILEEVIEVDDNPFTFSHNLW